MVFLLQSFGFRDVNNCRLVSQPIYEYVSIWSCISVSLDRKTVIDFPIDFIPKDRMSMLFLIDNTTDLRANNNTGRVIYCVVKRSVLTCFCEQFRKDFIPRKNFTLFVLFSIILNSTCLLL